MAAASAGVKTVALSGGCFLNRILLARLTALLEAEGLRVLSNHEVPPGDGGISLGQAYVAMWASDRATHA
jgi:hydrogenase maturation protein HypF